MTITTTGNQEYKQLDVRVAKAWNNKFAFKATFSFLQAKDWQADNYSNFDRNARAFKTGDRASDPGYDGINVYGDESAPKHEECGSAKHRAYHSHDYSGRLPVVLFNPKTALDQLLQEPVMPAYLGAIAGIPGLPQQLKTAMSSQYLPFLFPD